MVCNVYHKQQPNTGSSYSHKNTQRPSDEYHPALLQKKVAEPFDDGGNWYIFIFNFETKEEVETLLTTDPSISSGKLCYEIHPWLTSPTGSFF